MHTSHDARSDVYELEDTLSIPKVFRTLRDYRWPILLSTLGVLVAYVLIATAYFTLSPATIVTELPFRFEFQGAPRGEYPNGTKFNTADIVAGPVLLDVHTANHFDRYMAFEEFSRSVTIIESNREFDRLAAEYRARLNDPKLTSIDRERISTEYELKLASIEKSTYAVTFICGAGSKCPPPTVMKTVLADILRTWAKRAMKEKRVVLYRIPTLTTGALRTEMSSAPNRLAALLILRARVLDVITTIGQLSAIPGSELVRTPSSGLSHPEIQTQLRDTLRFDIEPLIESHVASSKSEETRRQLQGQLRFDQNQLDMGRARYNAYTATLAAYEQSPTVPKADNATSDRTGGDQREAAGTPVLGEGFIDRLVALSNRAADVTYRQRLVGDVRDAALQLIPMEAAVSYDERLLQELGSGGAPPSEEQAKQWDNVVSTVSTAITNVNALHQLISREMYAESLYATNGPTSSRLERGVSLKQLFFVGIILTVVALLAVVVIAFIHSRIRQDEEIDPEVLREMERDTVHV